MNKMRSASELNNYAESLAETTLNEFSFGEDDFEPFDGDETEYLAKRFLFYLNSLMGNK